MKSNVLDIENYLHAADAGLYASERESFGMGVLETMSFGKPVVATRVGGVTEIMRDGETGFLKRLGDVKAMAAAIRTLANDPELAARMGEAARVRARTGVFVAKKRGAVSGSVPPDDSGLPRLAAGKVPGIPAVLLVLTSGKH